MSYKKWVAAVLTVVMCIALSVPAFAESTAPVQAPSAYSISYCAKPTGGWVSNANVAIVKMEVARANAEIEFLVKYAQTTPWDDVDWLLARVDRIVKNVMRTANRLGVTVVCEYTEYVIDGRVVLIDPLMVIQ